MPITRGNVIAAAKILAQETGNTPLLTDPSSYDTALAIALRQFDADVPNLRIVHYAVLAAAFRFILRGAGAILTGSDAWVKGRSSLLAVWHPYATTSQGQTPLDPNTYRVLEEPTLTVLELLELAPNTGTLRLELTAPHTVDTDGSTTTILAGDVEAIQTLAAVKILEMAATRAVQNTGNTGIPTDIVDRRSQSSEWASRAKALFATYRGMVGQDENVAPAGVVRDLDVAPSFANYGREFLWHPRRLR